MVPLMMMVVVLYFRRGFVARLVCAMNLSGRNVVLLLGDDALVRLFATKSTPPRLYMITGPLSPEKVGGPKSVGLIQVASVPFYFWLKWIPTLESRGDFPLGVVGQLAYD